MKPFMGVGFFSSSSQLGHLFSFLVGHFVYGSAGFLHSFQDGETPGVANCQSKCTHMENNLLKAASKAYYTKFRPNSAPSLSTLIILT
jgi:hypothetical protein